MAVAINVKKSFVTQILDIAFHHWEVIVGHDGLEVADRQKALGSERNICVLKLL
jgi:hypothetical protein